ncbi:F-box/kelch-repeat protein At3g06240-like [Trifolium pratense]|uniref:F-box/kelch-repeat protein At3g06240-like n=1 Tax=Trifolium pratense TaxID=57577 RepID=UPI001E694FA9|nr:F-box/kelch-repeat protein At3g06240-like [Trifolium pratense]
MIREKVRNYIYDDLIFSILSKLPLKSLKRFGCVSKPWSLLFENNNFMSIFRNNFISNHHSCYEDTSLLLPIGDKVFHSPYSDRFENMVELDLPNSFQEENPNFGILDSGSITGILCLYSQNNDRIVFWNPTTKEFKVIPPSPLESVPPYQQFLIYLHGFGYDHVRDDYKLLRHVSYFPPSFGDCEYLGISYHDLPHEDILRDSFYETYSLRSNSWKKLDTWHDSSVRGSYLGERLYLDGKCNWWDYIDSDLPNVKSALASFDLANEVLFTTLIPLDVPIDVADEYMFYHHLVELCGFIAFITWIIGTSTFDISILYEVGVKESWTKLFIVGPLSCIERPIGTGKKGAIFFTKEDGEIFLFNLSTQKIEELGIQGIYSHVLFYRKNFLSFGG